jgi:hypothetical protein
MAADGSPWLSGPYTAGSDGSAIVKGEMMNQKYLVYALIFLAGVMLAPKVRALPVLSKLPTV